MQGLIGMIGGMGMPELLVILGIAVLIFGAGRIPEIARSLGKSIQEFKSGVKEVSDEVETAVKDGDSGNG